ncbi:DUF6457 domain-containing protein [Propioniciclava soli]|uniref:DUF6457 domain-containing protein n=1 Tax=Propioniciclava soli TaxID=2775081 RepID=A0ABZ3C968_9ACTN
MTRPPVDQALWQPWLDHVCAALELDPTRVDVDAILSLAGEVADASTRPLAPVAAHLWGLAGAGMPGVDAAALHDAILDAAHRSGRP